MDSRLEPLTATLHRQFLAYHEELLSLSKRAPALFIAGDWDQRLGDDLRRIKLYRRNLDTSAASAREILGEASGDRALWTAARRRFRERYADELATSYFTSAMRRVFTPYGASVEFDDDGIPLALVDPSPILRRFPIRDSAALGKVIVAGLVDSVFSAACSPQVHTDVDLLGDVVRAQLPEGRALRALELLSMPFFRGSGAYLVGCFRTNAEPVPVVISLTRSADGVSVDAVVAGFRKARTFLLSSTRSAFTVQTQRYQELYSFLQRLFPNANPAYILEVFGFTQPAKISLLRQLRRRLRHGDQFEYIGTGPVSMVLGLDGFPWVFKIIRRDHPDRQVAIRDFARVHAVDWLGQVLGSLDYRNVAIPKASFSAELLDLLAAEQSEDIILREEDLVLGRAYVVRRIVPVHQQLDTASKREAERVLLDVGWNIKHLAAMGFVPGTLSLEHFGLTTWNRVVYLNNAALYDIRRFHFSGNGEGEPAAPICVPRAEDGIITASPQAFEQELGIPQEHQDVFRAVHGDLFLPAFWQDRRRSILDGRYPEVFPYASRSRVESARFRRSVWDELQRASHTAQAHRIHLVLAHLAIVDVELAGLSFLRLEVRHANARVLVLEPIGPEIIAQLHRHLQDVTFDILQSKSEVIEASGQWTPGIHGKLKALVQVRDYDYVIGYVNETFDAEFFRLARLKGFLLLSTGTHNIDVAAATATLTVVTNAPGPTTTTVAEQNIGLILEAVFCRSLARREGPLRPAHEHMSASVLAQLMWLSLLKEALRLEDMFSFGASDHYVRTGVGDHATVYHDQVGQNLEAGIQRSVGVLGLSEVGLRLVELAVAHEVSTIYLHDQEHAALPDAALQRIEQMLAVVREVSPTVGLCIRLVPVPLKELHERADYLFETRTDALEVAPHDGQLCYHAGRLAVGNVAAISALRDLVLGIQGLGRIGDAVAQRALVLGFDILVHQRNPERAKYRNKRERLDKLAAHRARWSGRTPTVTFTEDKDQFFSGSNIVSTLSATTAGTLGWVDAAGLEQLARGVPSDVRVIVSAGKGLVDEDALLSFLRRNPDAEARLDVLIGEHGGRAHLKLVDDQGLPLKNVRVTGHTAAAVREVRRLKVFKALHNLRHLIDGRLPPDIINNTSSPNAHQSIVEIEGLKFFRMEVPSPVARLLVIEPLPPPLVLQIQQQFGDVSFDMLLEESELVQTDGRWSPGINTHLNAIVAARSYDYCLGYCNADFDAAFFEAAGLKGLVLFATAVHHIDLAAATAAGTLVTSSPGFTTVAVAEQNICMALDALFGRCVQDFVSAETTALHQLDALAPEPARTVAQILWFMLLKSALRLDAMYEFGASSKYVRTGLRRDATVYHHQLGQHQDAGIDSSLGIIGLDEVGIHLVELAVVHELSTIYVLEEEYARLAPLDRARLERLADAMREVSTTEGLSVHIRAVESDVLIERATYFIKTPAAYRDASTRELRSRSAIAVQADAVYLNDLSALERSFIGLTFGVQGLGRIGEAVVQRALALGATTIVCQRNPDRPRYQQKLERLRRLARDRSLALGCALDVAYVDKETLFRSSNVVTTLASTTSSTRFWVDGEALDMLGSQAKGPVRIFINAGKGLLNEAALEPYLQKHPEVEVRLDVLSDEQRGGAGQRFRDHEGRPLANLKIAGHTAAAVPQLRRLKVFNALSNLRLYIDGGRPNHIVNPDVLAE